MLDPVWQVARGDQVLGTLPESEIRALLNSGFLVDSDLCRADAAGEWQPLSRLRASAEGISLTPVASSTRSGAESEELSRRDIPIQIARSAAVLTAKVAHGVFAHRRKVSDAAAKLLHAFIPQIKHILHGLAGTTAFRAAQSRIHDDAFMRKFFGAAYDCLPRPMQRFVNEESFIAFCLNNRQRLLGEIQT